MRQHQRRIPANIKRTVNTYPSETISKIAEEEAPPRSFCEVSVTLRTKPD